MVLVLRVQIQFLPALRISRELGSKGTAWPFFMVWILTGTHLCLGALQGE